MDPILLIIADVPIMVASSTGISAAVIRTNLAWPINKLKPIKRLIPCHILVTEHDLTLRVVIKGL